MLHNKLNINLLLLFVFLFLVSCTQNDKTEEGKTAIIRLLVSSANSNVNTRSSELTTAEEDLINDIHILVYNSLGELIGHKYTSYNPSNPAITVETRSSNSTCTIYAIANTGSSTYFNGKAYSEDNLKTLVTEDLSSVDGIKKGTSGSQYFLMSGSIIVSKIDPGTNTVSSSLSLSRLAAKIKFNITASNGITITDYSVKNIPKNSYLVNNTSVDAATNYLSTGLTTLSAGTTSVSDQYFYMYENLKGGRTGTGTPTDQTGKALYAPANSTYIEIHAKSSIFNGLFKIYLGADNVSDYNIKRNNSYNYDIQLLGPGYADTRVTHYGFTLSANSSTQNNSYVYSSGVSNCYIVAPGSSVYIPVIRANQSALGTQISDITSSTEWAASLLWQTSSGLVTVSNDAAARTSGCFKVTASSSAGNAVVAVKNTSGTILWSWHIWVTDYNPDVTNESINGYIWMDRNLGAITKATNLSDNTYAKCGGLMYQWGRKDPFPGSDGKTTGAATVLPISNFTVPLYSSVGLSTTQIDQYVYSAEASTAPITYSNQLKYSVNYPLLFLKNWAGSEATQAASHSTAGGLHSWGGELGDPKSIYDPCPSGWRVPSGKRFSSTWSSPWSSWTSTSILSASAYTTVSWNNSLSGYYPAAGGRTTEGFIYDVGLHLTYWSATGSELGSTTNSEIGGYDMGIIPDGTFYPGYGSSRAYAFIIRCVKE